MKKMTTRNSIAAPYITKKGCKRRFLFIADRQIFNAGIIVFLTTGRDPVADELGQFAVDAGRAPERVGQAHVPDQPTELKRDARSPATPPGFPTPERSKSSPMPTNHGLRPDDGQRIQNTGSEAIQPNEHQSVECPENRSLRGIAPQHTDLLPETRISASSRTLKRNELVGAVHSSIRTSTIRLEHHPIRPAS